MKYPSAVPERVCKTAVHVTIYSEDISEDGAPAAALDGDFNCNYQDSAKTILTDERKLVQITGKALFCGDIVPDVAAISGGELVVNGVKRRILQGSKARNPDGTVNYTSLDLI